MHRYYEYISKNREFLIGVKTSIPIMIGYLPIAISFGVVSENYGFPSLLPILMSAIVYAGFAPAGYPPNI